MIKSYTKSAITIMFELTFSLNASLIWNRLPSEIVNFDTDDDLKCVCIHYSVYMRRLYHISMSVYYWHTVDLSVWAYSSMRGCNTTGHAV